ncbi:MAG: hypothetical protein JNL08_09785 [Planctomycetes bacterium]|nr:hypothetical protein [Planctomycetota bacterium]
MRIRALLPLLSFCLAMALPAQGELKAGPWQTAGKIPPGWVVHNTKNYHVQSQCGIDKAKRLGAHMEIMNAVYRSMFKPDKAGAKLQTIKLFQDEASYHAYGGPQGAAAYFSWTEREMVCYDTGKWSDEVKADGPTTGPETPLDRLKRRRSRFLDMLTMDLLGTAAHEGWHQYFDWYVGSKVDLPSWIDEGMGDYFYAAAPKRDAKGKKPSATLGLPNDGRLWVLQVAQRQGLMVPLERFVTMLQGDYYSNPDVCYAQGWAFCQFLLHAENGKYAKVIPNYVRLIKDDSNWRVVTEKAFKGLDLKVMDKEFHAYVQSLKPTVQDPMAEDDEPEPEAGAEPTPAPPAEGTPPAAGDGH